MFEIGFDIGGTFTDFVVRDLNVGRVRYLKVPTTPQPSGGVIDGLRQIFDTHGIDPGKVRSLKHATTIAANAVVERKGSKTALIATSGFRDVLFIGTGRRPNTYDMRLDKPDPFVRRRDIFTVKERVDAKGSIVEALDEKELMEIAGEIETGGYQAVAIAFINSFANPCHERAAWKLLEERNPNVKISISSDVTPKWREYERTITTVANAYVQPVVASYLEEIETGARALGLTAPLSIMQSSGGIVSPELARDYPVRIIESGPAAGVLLCNVVGAAEGHANILTFDMGGTTAKLGAIDNGAPSISPTFEVATTSHIRGSGLPLNINAIELLEIGAGGGSIARVQRGTIVVGPESAASHPGPICYCRGGVEPTVTDANLVLGFLDPLDFNGGAMTLDLAGAREGIWKSVAEPLGLSIEEAAWGIHAVANFNMTSAMRVVSEQRGRNPQDYALIAFGGSGPIHACSLAEAQGVRTVIIPNGAGVGSALGLLEAQTKIDVSKTARLQLDRASPDDIARIVGDLKAMICAEFEKIEHRGNIAWDLKVYVR